MAGDWIPMRTDLTDDPAVVAIAAAVGIDEFAVVGRLHRLWSWANGHLIDGHAKAVTVQWVDRYVDATGFAAAMLDAGWLRTRSGGIEFPLFDRWNSQGAKRRVTQNRSKQQVKSTGDTAATNPRQGGDIACRQNVAQSREEEEKRREDKEENPPTPHGGDGRDSPEPRTDPVKSNPRQKSKVLTGPPPEGFAEFWSKYPNKADKKAAIRAFVNLAPSPELLATMMSALAGQVLWPKWSRDGGQYVPNPATWINNRRWDDEPPAAIPPTASGGSASKPPLETPAERTQRILATINAENAAKGRPLI